MKSTSPKGDEDPQKPHEVHKAHPPNEKIKSETTKRGQDKISLNFSSLQTSIRIPIPKQYSGKHHPPVVETIQPPPPPPPQPPIIPPPVQPIQPPPVQQVEVKPKVENTPEDIFNVETFVPSKIEVRIPKVTEKNRAVLTKLNTPRSDVPPLESPKFLEKAQHLDINTVTNNTAAKPPPPPNPVSNLQMLLQTASKAAKPAPKVQKKVLLKQFPPQNQPIFPPINTEPPKEVSFPQFLMNTQNSLLNTNPAAIAAAAAARTIQAQKIIFPFQIPPKTEPEQKIPPPTPVCAAPNPGLPPASEIRALIDGIDGEIAILKQNMQVNIHELEISFLSASKTSEIKTETNVQNYHGFLIPHNPIEFFKKANSEKIAKSHAKYKLPVERRKYLHITQLPKYCEEMKSEETNINPMLRVIMQEKALLRHRKIQLAWEYKQRSIPWNEFNTNLSIYTHESHESIDLWPPEFAVNKLKTTDKSILLPLCAPDQPMLLSDADKEAELYFDENNFVENPEAEHKQYKNRISWTESEIRIFLEKYAQHPRQFKKIAAALPLKSVKDVIEFYYIQRIKMNLKDLEKIGHTRGRRKALFIEHPL
ncbi:Myb-like DNA-binding domain containing protein [Trichomonas vaginalis G3]|uniref:Myb-like DNA-binding domain containing protein n=1 Tax=Trichomonas vaginalis (strain ATCC PRA-98 / G3) TaxID=412133 RepID=A2FSG2_TRIV3|nr:glycolytic process regulation protein [Trichomonas vaginalis G3]EAX92159.1 Myb-like DNA-binding domain containing protein [Trichomonas vaginalis G3]KAI5538937.1 glycolytic process regulation protein [Trichomonas vaginalis G3]|eukprot:XP_001305089.1 Myb-like DNA-binding domain containing protein [Trichomonas vaginalis G3]